MSLRDRIQERLDATGLSPQAASLAAGLHRDAIRNILRGRSVSASVETLSALAPILGVSLSWLSGHDATVAPTIVKGAVARTPEPGRNLSIRHEVGAGYWVAAGSQIMIDRNPLPLVSDTDYASFDQWAERVIGSTPDAEYPPGTLVHVVEPAAIGGQPHRGQHVIIVRSRAGGREVERSIREAVPAPGGLEYRARSPREAGEFQVRLGREGDIETTLGGLVLGSYRPRR